ncbi:MAG: hypothetical protein ACLGJB_16175 [Blastocatellia bacterium]
MRTAIRNNHAAAVNMKLRKSVSRGIIRRGLKRLPVIGTGAAVVLAAGTVRRKGFFKGGADVLLDIVPFVGLTKGLVEVFTGDLIPDKKTPPARDAE